jgi:putative endonuclease
LEQQGYRVLERRLRNRFGEIDLIATDGQRLIFVEVKTWRDAQGGHPAEAVTTEKQRRLRRAATLFLRSRDLAERPVRFDVIAITWPADSRRPHIEHFRGAFPGLDNGVSKRRR